jgi:hypothetical protein
MDLTQALVHQLFNYDETTGIFTHKINKCKAKAGSVAGGKHPSTNAIYLRVNGKKELAHRIAWLYHFGELPNGDIDHINHDRSDNRIENLRVVDHSINMKNKSKYKNNKYGCTGVSMDKRVGRYRAYLSEDGKQTGLGYYENYEDAVNARLAAIKTREAFHANHGK